MERKQAERLESQRAHRAHKDEKMRVKAEKKLRG
jgi:hypothetical protein